MATNSIGSLFIDISARTATLESDLGKVKSQVKDLTDNVNDAGNSGSDAFSGLENKVTRFGIALLGAQSLVRVMARDIRDVIDNIEDIPGVPAEVVASIQNLRHELVGAKNDLNVAIATEISWFAKLGQSIGAIIADVVTPGGAGNIGNDLTNVWNGGANKQLTPDELATDRDPDFPKKVKQSQSRLDTATENNNSKGLDDSQKLNALYAQYLDLINQSNDATLNSVQINDLLTKATEKYGETLQLIYTLKSKLDNLTSQDDAVILTRQDLFATKQTKLNDLVSQRQALEVAYQALISPNGQIIAGDETKAIALKTQELAVDQKINVAMKNNGELAKSLGDGIASSFTDAIVKGEGLVGILQSIGQEVLKILANQFIDKPLAGFLDSAFGDLFGTPIPKAAAGGPVDGLTLVGENGPELISASAGQTITPNSQLGNGQGGGTNIFNIDARSADQTGLANLFTLIKQLDGSINARAVAAVKDANRRT